MNILISIIKVIIESIVDIFGMIFELFQKSHDYKGGFGNPKKVLRYSHDNNAIRIGNKYISLKQSLNGGMLLIGKTGIGKSTKIFFQNLFGADNMTPTSFICLDPTRELRDQTMPYLCEELEYQEDIFNMSDASQSSVTWNPIENLPNHLINRFASELVAINSGANPKDPIWNNMASNLIAMMIRLLQSINKKEYINLYNVRFLIKSLQSDIDIMNMLVSKYASDKVFQDFKSILKNDERFLGSVISSTLSVLTQWEDINVIKTTSKTNLDMASYRTSKKILFIQNHIMSQSYLTGLNSLFLKQWFNHITEQGIPKENTNVISFLIDEASSLQMADKQYIPFVVSQIRKYRSYGIWGFQSFAQVEHLYGKEGAETLRHNTGTVLYLGNQSLDTGKTISQSLGKYSYSKGDRKLTREVLTPQEAMYLKGAEQGGILISGHQPPMKIKNIQPYYENHSYKKWAEQDAPNIISNALDMPPLLPITELVKNEYQTNS